MNKDWLIFLAIGALLIGATGGAIYMGTRGLRNNNPGNIRHGNSAWQGMSGQQTDSAFVQFDDPAYGIRALAKLLKNYQSRHGLNTIREVINRWAPPNENDTGSYVNSVAQKVQISPDQQINVEEHLPALVTAIIRHENGSQPYSDAVVMEGIRLS